MNKNVSYSGWTGMMTQWHKYLLQKHKDLSSEPLPHIKWHMMLYRRIAEKIIPESVEDLPTIRV